MESLVYNKHKLIKILSKALIYIILIVSVILVFFPVFWMVNNSFKPNDEAFNFPPKILPERFTLENYISQLKNRTGFLTYFKNGVLVSSSVVILTIFLSVLSGYSLSRFKYKGQKAILMFMLSTQMFPLVLLVISIYLIYYKLGLINTYPGLILSFTNFSLPFSIWMIKGFCDSVPMEIEEAAYVDGCSKLGVLFRIVIPTIIPGIVAISLFTFLLSWNNLLFALQLASKSNLLTIPPGFLREYYGQYNYYWTSAFAGSTIVTIPIAVIFIFFQKQFVSGLTAGAVKG